MPPRRRKKTATTPKELPQEYEPDGWPFGYTFDRVRRVVIERAPDGRVLSEVAAVDSPLMAPWVNWWRRRTP